VRDFCVDVLSYQDHFMAQLFIVILCCGHSCEIFLFFVSSSSFWIAWW